MLETYSVNGNIVFKPGRKLIKILQDYITPFMGARDIFVNRCMRDLVLNNDVDTIYFDDVNFHDENIRLTYGAIPPINANERINDLIKKQRIVDSTSDVIKCVKTSATYIDNLNKCCVFLFT